MLLSQRAFLLTLTLAVSSCGADQTTRVDGLPKPRDVTVGQSSRDKTGPGDDGSGGLDQAPGREGPAGSYLHEEVPVQQVYQWIVAARTQALVDVREPGEFAESRIGGAINLPWTSGVLASSYSQLPKDRPLVISCRTGNRSHQAAAFLAAKGLKPVFDMSGGIVAWTAAGLPVEK